MLSGSQRHLFEIPDEVTYLNCSYMAPNLAAVRAAGQSAVARKSRPWEIAVADFFTDSERARDLFAGLIGADADGVAITPAASYGVELAAANLPLAAGERVLVLAEQFPSHVYPWRAAAQRAGAEVVTVARPADLDWTAALLELLDERTAIVAVPRCHWTDGSALDLERVGDAARRAGAALVVDGTQSVGADPFDVGAVQPDFLATATYKWLLGPYSFGFCYVAPQWREGTPLERNWIARRDSEDFAGLVDYTDEFQPGARRYDVGERSNFALTPMVVAGLEQIHEWSVPAIAEYTAGITARIEAAAGRLGLDAIPEKRRVAHLIGVRMPGGLPPDLLAGLAAQHIYVSVRGDSIRLSPHVYNTSADVDRLFAALGELT